MYTINLRVFYIEMIFKAWVRPPKKSVAMEWIFVSPSNRHDKILTPNMIVLGGGAFGRFLGHKCGTLMSRIDALIK